MNTFHAAIANRIAQARQDQEHAIRLTIDAAETNLRASRNNIFDHGSSEMARYAAEAHAASQQVAALAEMARMLGLTDAQIADAQPGTYFTADQN